MNEKQINIAEILEKVHSKYLLVMITAKRARQLSLLEQKETILNLDAEKLKNRPDLENIGNITNSEKKELEEHKPILASLNEISNNEIEYRVEEESADA